MNDRLEPGTKLMALNWKQPYLHLMIHAGKIETRTWGTRYRGLVLMCSSKVPYSIEDARLISGYDQYERMRKYIKPNVHEIHASRGKAIAIGRLAHCRPMVPADENKCFVMYHEDLFCHIYEDIRLIEPMDWKGKPGLQWVKPEIIKHIRFLT